MTVRHLRDNSSRPRQSRSSGRGRKANHCPPAPPIRLDKDPGRQSVRRSRYFCRPTMPARQVIHSLGAQPREWISQVLENQQGRNNVEAHPGELTFSRSDVFPVECWTQEKPVLPWSHLKTIMEIINKTQKPLSVPLPGGKKLFLGPGKTAQVTPKALEHPPVVKLLEARDIEVTEGDPKRKQWTGDKAGTSSGSRHTDTGAMRQSGDR